MEWKFAKWILQLLCSIFFLAIIIAVSIPVETPPISVGTTAPVLINDCTLLLLKLASSLVYVALCGVVLDHVNHLNNMSEQLPILFVVSMPSFYTLIGCLGFNLTALDILLNSLVDGLRELYGCLVLGMLLSLMLSNLHLPIFFRSGINDSLRTKAIELHWPLSYFLPKQIVLTDKNIQVVKLLVWQAFLVRIIGTPLLLLLQFFGIYSNMIGWVFAGIYFMSSTASVLTVTYFYNAVSSDTSLINPLSKCFWTKGFVALIFYQDKVLSFKWNLGNADRCLFTVLGMLILSGINYRLFSAKPYYKAPDIECLTDCKTLTEIVHGNPQGPSGHDE